MNKRKVRVRKPGAVIVLEFILCVAVCIAIVLISVTPPKYEISAGEIAQTTIQAPRDVVDTISTQALVDKTVSEVPPIFKEDTTITDAVKDQLNTYFNHIESIRSYAQRKYLLERTPQDGTTVEFTPSTVTWKNHLTPENIDTLNSMTENSFTADEVYSIAALTQQNVERMTAETIALMEKEMNLGVKEENLDEHVFRLSTQIYTNPLYNESMKRFATKAAYLLKPNMIFDETATRLEREEVKNSVAPLTFKKGQNIIQEGEIVTRAQIGVLEDLGLVRNDTIDYILYLGVGLYLLLIFGMCFAYFFVFERKLIYDIKKMTILYLIVTSTVALCFLLSKFSPMVTAVFMGSILIGALIKPRMGIMITILLSFVTAPIAASNEGILSVTGFLYLNYTLLGGMCAIYFIRRTQHRISFIIAGTAAGFTGALSCVAFGLVIGTPTQDTINLALTSLLCGIVGSFVTLGILPVFESMFKLATPTKLLELLNPNQKLLRRLSIEAPATYHHSTVCANLAESAAEAIGANGLLARCAGYYHDIGKLKNPQMFTENQRGENPHDTLAPENSCEIIRGHVTHGVYLAQKYGLPKEVIGLIEQHHGNTAMAVFYAKAKAENPHVSMDDFRYGNKKPQTKEAAIILLSDVTEAAVKSIGLHERDKIMELMDRLFAERCNDGQFDECDISLKDLQLIKQAFLGVYEGVFHERVKYPTGD